MRAMKKNNVIAGLIFIYALNIAVIGNSQQTLWFGTVKMQDKIKQGRFEVFSDGVIKTIVYAPYGITPTTFKDVKQHNNQLTFSWQIDQLSYHCQLSQLDSTAYSGN